MLSRIADSPIDPEKLFGDDILERTQLAHGLVALLKKTTGPLTLALTAPYGGGKTYFLERCKVLFEREKIPFVALNAWETDFASEPIAPLIATLTGQFANLLGPGDQRIEKLKSFGAKIAAAAVPVAVRLLTAGILHSNDFTEKAFADATQKIAEQEFQRFDAAKKSIDSFREELTKLGEAIHEKMESTVSIVIVVDELDRCRPTYAIEVLETIKHLFNVPGLVFLLGVDRRQLASCASAVFGQGVDADGYLRRFIDLECALPQGDLMRMLASDGKNIFHRATGLNPALMSFEITHAVGIFCHEAGFSIRRSQHLVIRVGLARTAAEYTGDLDVATFLTCMREYDEDLYKQIIAKQIDPWNLYLAIDKISSKIFAAGRFQLSLFMRVVAMYAAEVDFKAFFASLKASNEPQFLNQSELDKIEGLASDYSRGWIARHVAFVEFGAAFVIR